MPRLTTQSRIPWLIFVAVLLGSLPGHAARGNDFANDAGACDRLSFVTVLDVGHSVEAGGATSARGVPEYTFNLRLAQRIEQGLFGAGFPKVYLLVARGVGKATLLQRSARANELVASLFISIHHDSVQDIYLQKWTYNGKVQEFSDRFRGYSIFISSKNLQPRASIEAAQFLGDQLQARGLQFTKHHAEDIDGERRPLIDEKRGVYRYDNLVVLRNTIAPAMLLEAGVIVNRDEETVLATAAYQDTISAAVVAAVERFCALQTSRVRSATPDIERPLPQPNEAAP